MTPPNQDELSAFIQAHTALVSPPGCPELKLHLATAMTSLWQASEKFLPGVTVTPPYWSLAWAGGQGLARHVLENRWLVRGRRVLDFVAGSGIAGLAAIKAGAGPVDAYDPDPLARAAIALNGRTNDAMISVIADDPEAIERPPWEVVLVGDLGYEVAAAQRHLPWLRKLGAQGILVLVADPGGTYDDSKGLVHLADYEIPTATGPDAVSQGMRNAAIYRVGG